MVCVAWVPRPIPVKDSAVILIRSAKSIAMASLRVSVDWSLAATSTHVITIRADMGVYAIMILMASRLVYAPSTARLLTQTTNLFVAPMAGCTKTSASCKKKPVAGNRTSSPSLPEFVKKRPLNPVMAAHLPSISSLVKKSAVVMELLVTVQVAVTATGL